MGDSALYLLGFFQDAVQNQMVGANYYVTMGESAYSSAANLSRVNREHALTAASIYAELSERFTDLVFLLKTMSLYGENLHAKTNLTSAQLMELIERYRKTKNPELLELLKQNGVSFNFLESNKKKKQHNSSFTH